MWGDGMVYVSSDWHGVSVEAIKRLLDKAGFSDDDFLFVLGDIIDRGENGIELIKEIMFEPNIKLIRGNHEQMMLACEFLLDEITDESLNDFDMNKILALQAWQINDGDITMKRLRAESVEMREMIFEFLQDTPLYDTVSVGNQDFLLVHSGLQLDEEGRLKKLSECSEDDILWTRPKITDRYSDDFITIFGHTPTEAYGKEYSGKILRTDTWIDIDVGAVNGSSPCLLRLDDMREFYLE